ncbi:MAG: hypothetical protein EAZ55_14080 [Cytophagales bacterium]|nr:MAG: hypothetical protein EAZ55_14080 [Cytophagales bacterium]
MNFDFTTARFKHLNWRFRIRNFLDGKETLTHEQATSHTDCELGKWIYEKALKNYANVEAIHQLEKVHKDLHAKIREVIALKNNGNSKDAEFVLREVFAISDEVIFYLDEAEKKVTV